jgi:hypothetical protein
MELKPCPFCGSEPAIDQLVDVFGNETWEVFCPKLFCPVMDVCSGEFPTKKRAINAWNTRDGDENEEPCGHNYFKEFEGDPEFIAYSTTLELTEAICTLHPEQKLPIRWIIRAIEWLVDAAVYLYKR